VQGDAPNERWDVSIPPRRRVFVEDGVKALSLLDRRWDALVERQPRPNPTLLAEWQRDLAGLGFGRPLVVTVERGGELVAGGAFSVRAKLRGKLTVASWLGGDRQNHSPDIIVAPGHDDAAAALVDALLERVHLVLVPTLEDGHFRAAVLRRKPTAHIKRLGDETLVVTLPPLTRSKLLREIAKDQRHADRVEANVKVRIAAQPVAVADALERLFALHRERWEDRPWENANFSTDESTRAWHRSAIGALARDDRVRVVEVEEDGVVVASHLSLRAGPGGLAYAMAMRKGRGLRSPGHRAYFAATEVLQSEGVQILDIGGGTLDPASPKGKLAPKTRPFTLVLVSSSSAIELVAAAAYAARSFIRRFLPARDRPA
jgi:CelD/BcsL family acetyltransferase involved in cellulose biosynthesis